MFYSLLKSSLWGTPLKEKTELSANEMASLFETAQKQSVIGLVSHALVSNNVTLDDRHAMLAMGFLKKIPQNNAKNIVDMVSLSRFMENSGMPMVVVKGQTLAALYPTPELRECGDIDFFCGASNFVKARQLMAEKLGVKFDDGIPVKHLEFKIDGTQYELHRILSIFSRPKSQRRFNEIMEKALLCREKIIINDKPVPILPATENLLFQTVHVFYHIYKEGVGLRQLCDMAIFIHRMQDEIDFQKLSLWLKELHLTKVFEAIVSLLVSRLGLKLKDSSPLLKRFNIASDEEHLPRLSRWIWEDVEEGGNFGVAVRKNRKLTIFRHYVRYALAAPTEIFYIPFEKFTRRIRGLED